MERTYKAPSIAILIRHSHRWPEALQAVNLLQGPAGAVVTIFILCNEREEGGSQFDNMIASIKHLNLDCFVDQPVAGMVCMPLETVAERLKQFELVIPI